MNIKAISRTLIRKMPFYGCIKLFIKKTFLIRSHFDSPSVWLNELLKGKHVIIVQIGSNDGKNGDPIYQLIKKNPEWEALFVEPVPYLFERLKINYGNHKRFSFENVAINYGTKQKFYSVKEDAKLILPDLPYWYDQLGSFDKNNILKHLNGILEPYIEETIISGITLEELFKRNNIDRINLLHIDTEGYDWNILSQLNIDYLKPEIILIEHKHLPKDEKIQLINFLKTDYLVFRLGGDIIAMTNNESHKDVLRKLKGERMV